jgi:hypothetical protein
VLIEASIGFPMCYRSVGCGTAKSNATGNAIGFTKFRVCSHDAVIRVYDEAGNVIETQEHRGEFKKW